MMANQEPVGPAAPELSCLKRQTGCFAGSFARPDGLAQGPEGSGDGDRRCGCVAFRAPPAEPGSLRAWWCFWMKAYVPNFQEFGHTYV